MKISSFWLWIPTPLLVASLALATSSPVVAHADTFLPPGTESNAGSLTDAWLVARGLIGHGMIRETSDVDAMTPPSGTEVSETRQTANPTGEVLTQVKMWNE